MNTMEPASPRADRTTVVALDEVDHHDPCVEARQLKAQVETLAALVADLEAALESRDVIGQAKGIIIAACGCSSDEAFALLKAQSQTENRKLVTIAAEIVARRTGTSTRPPTPPGGQGR